MADSIENTLVSYCMRSLLLTPLWDIASGVTIGVTVATGPLTPGGPNASCHIRLKGLA